MGVFEIASMQGVDEKTSSALEVMERSTYRQPFGQLMVLIKLVSLVQAIFNLGRLKLLAASADEEAYSPGSCHDSTYGSRV